jgi:hypothetical protein
VKRIIIVSLVVVASTAPPAVGKGLELSLDVLPTAPVAGERLEIELRGELTVSTEKECSGMRVIAVAPGISIARALKVVEGGVGPRRIGARDAFRLQTLRRVGDLHWTARLRPSKPGRWTLVVPNLCSSGYVLPVGFLRRTIEVRVGQG